MKISHWRESRGSKGTTRLCYEDVVCEQDLQDQLIRNDLMLTMELQKLVQDN